MTWKIKSKKIKINVKLTVKIKKKKKIIKDYTIITRLKKIFAKYTLSNQHKWIIICHCAHVNSERCSCNLCTFFFPTRHRKYTVWEMRRVLSVCIYIYMNINLSRLTKSTPSLSFECSRRTARVHLDHGQPACLWKKNGSSSTRGIALVTSRSCSPQVFFLSF